MEKHIHTDDPTPPDCFRIEELEIFQSLESQTLVDVNYYLWLNQAEMEGVAPMRFLYALELLFESNASLILSSGEDSAAIRLIDAASLLATAKQLQDLHGKVLIQRISALAQPLWEGVVWKVLEGIHLSKSEVGLYHNDALLLDFGSKHIMVNLSAQEGLELAPYE